ncbi:PepSY domain-containing protein [Marinilabiliaceae bacterium JC017]|nr:PepSY domain-containing protein [Marinilabiliaceae bacterium JC017]
MSSRKIVRKMHLWLGLPSAVLVFVICLSGSVFVFADEIICLVNRENAHVVPQSRQIPIDEMITTVRKTFPDHILLYCISYKQTDKAVLFVVGKKSEGLSYVYVNPYNKQIVGQSRVVNFFSLTAHLHKQLLLGRTGSWIVLIATCVFLIELITGLIIWWPKNKNKKYFKKTLKVKRNSTVLRKIIDWHRVLGLYFLFVMLLLSITGIVLFFIPKQGIEAQKNKPLLAALDTSQKAMPIAPIVGSLMKHQQVELVKTELWDIEKSTQMQCIAASESGVLTFNGTLYLFNKYTGCKSNDVETVSNVELRNIFRKLHVGDWMGWFGKLITFTTGLAGAFLALSGIIIWWKKSTK